MSAGNKQLKRARPQNNREETWTNVSSVSGTHANQQQPWVDQETIFFFSNRTVVVSSAPRNSKDWLQQCHRLDASATIQDTMGPTAL
ncbi:hypothetical protein SLE2022_028860 [Rubroshorea leprosula]